MKTEDLVPVMNTLAEASLMINKLAIAAQSLTLAASDLVIELFGVAAKAENATPEKMAEAWIRLSSLLEAGRGKDVPELDDVTAGFDQLTFSDRTGAVTRTYAETADEEDGADADSGNDTDV